MFFFFSSLFVLNIFLMDAVMLLNQTKTTLQDTKICSFIPFAVIPSNGLRPPADHPSILICSQVSDSGTMRHKSFHFLYSSCLINRISLFISYLKTLCFVYCISKSILCNWNECISVVISVWTSYNHLLAFGKSVVEYFHTEECCILPKYKYAF